MLHNQSSKSRRASQPERSVDGRVIGSVRGDTFIKNVIYSKHHMRTPPGWAIDAAAVNRLRAQGVKRIEVRDRESGRVWRCSLEEFIRRSIEKHYGGFGKQLLLPDAYWTETPAGGQFTEQLSLF